MAKTLAQVLSGPSKAAPAAAPAPVQSAQPEASPTVEQDATTAGAEVEDEAEEDDDEGQEQPSAQAEAAAEPPKSSEKDGAKPQAKAIPYQRFKTELDKRHEAERRANELQSRLDALARTPGTTPAQVPPPPDPNDLTEESFFGKGPEAVKQYVNHVVRQAVARTEGQHIARSVNAVLAKHEDAGDLVAEFDALAARSPVLHQQLREASDPGEFAYQTVKLARRVQPFGTFEELEAKIREEERAKLEEEFKTKLAQQAAASLPTSTAGARGSGTGAAPAPKGPKSLKDVVARAKRAKG